jgi:hypothetical protein
LLGSVPVNPTNQTRCRVYHITYHVEVPRLPVQQTYSLGSKGISHHNIWYKKHGCFHCSQYRLLLIYRHIFSVFSLSGPCRPYGPLYILATLDSIDGVWGYSSLTGFFLKKILP